MLFERCSLDARCLTGKPAGAQVFRRASGVKPLAGRGVRGGQPIKPVWL